MNQKKKPPQKQNALSPDTFENKQEIQSDVMGSYTGIPEDGDRPIQDADDL